MSSHQSNSPFYAAALLFGLWGTGKCDSDVAFYSVVLGCGYFCVALLEVDPSNIKQLDFPEIPLFMETRAVREELSGFYYFLLCGFLFFVGVVGTTIFNYSPFIGTVLYSLLSTTMLRDLGIAEDARIIVWTCMLLSGVVSEHVFRVNVAAALFAGLCLEKNINFTGTGTFETVAFFVAILCLIVHDLVVRLLLVPLVSVLQALCLSLVSFVIVDSALELGIVSGNLASASKVKNQAISLINVTWDEGFASDVVWQVNQLPHRLIVVAPVFSCLFCLAYICRAMRVHRRELDWIKWQQCIGIGLGVSLGLKLWSKYIELDDFDNTSPVTCCWVLASMLFSASTLVGTSDIKSSQWWHTMYWNSSRSGVGNKKKITTYLPSSFFSSFSVSFPEIYELASQLEEAEYSWQLANYRIKPSKEISVKAAKQAFTATSLLHSVTRLAEDLLEKFATRLEALAKEVAVYSKLEGHDSSLTSSMTMKTKQKLSLLKQDSAIITSFVDRVRIELAEQDQRTFDLISRTIALKKFSSKTEEDDLEYMAEATKKRIKRRKKDEDRDAHSSTPPPATPVRKPMSIPKESLPAVAAAVANPMLTTRSNSTLNALSLLSTSSGPFSGPPQKPMPLSPAIPLSSINSPFLKNGNAPVAMAPPAPAAQTAILLFPPNQSEDEMKDTSSEVNSKSSARRKSRFLPSLTLGRSKKTSTPPEINNGGGGSESADRQSSASGKSSGSRKYFSLSRSSRPPQSATVKE